VPKSLWEGGFKQRLAEQTKSITVGACTEFQHFQGPVIGRPAFDKITGIIEQAKKDGGEVLAGGEWDDSKGYFIQPTVIVTKDPKSITMTQEIFGPVMTVYVYEDDKFEETCALIEDTTEYALTGAIFGQDRVSLQRAAHLLRNAAGNFYINDKCTGAVPVPQVPTTSRDPSRSSTASSRPAPSRRTLSLLPSTTTLPT
jgi:1-pyrroline-5-carboxylate dehydrogenase